MTVRVFFAVAMILVPFAALAADDGLARITPVALNPVDPKLQLPTEPATLFYPAVRPDWCDKSANVCYGPEDEAKMMHEVAGFWIRPHVMPHSRVKDGSAPEVGKPCVSSHFKPDVEGVLYRKTRRDWRGNTSTQWPCQPLPDGKAEVHIQIKPGHTYNRCAHLWLYGDVILSSPKGTPLDQRPVLVAHASMPRNPIGSEGNACVAVGSGRNLKIYGIVIKANEKIDGAWSKKRGVGIFYRCVQSTGGMTILVNTDLINCAHGVQGGGKEWHIYNSRILNASYTGNGLNHALYGVSTVTELSIIGSHIQSCGGHAVKAIIRNFRIENSIIENAIRPECDNGTTIHNSYAGYASLDNVRIIKGSAKASVFIFSTGDGDPKRCKGVDGYRGVWTLSRVAIIDKSGKYIVKGRVHENDGGCKNLKRSKWIDGGGVTYNGVPLTFEGDRLIVPGQTK